MNLADVMSRMTLRKMGEARRLWREHAGPDGPKLEQALADNDDEYAPAAMVAAHMRTNGHPGFTLEDALDVELDMTAGADVGEANGGSNGGPPVLSPATGT